MTTEIERLRDVNTVLFEQLREANRKENRQRIRAEKAEDRIALIERLTDHVEMERSSSRNAITPSQPTTAGATAPESER